MRTAWRTEWPHWLLIGVMFLAAAVSWPAMPDRIPVHWNLQGEVDRYGGRFEGLLLTPLVALGMYLLLLVVPRFDPNRANYATFAGPYRQIRFAVLLMLAAGYGLILLTTWGYDVDAPRVLLLLVGALFVWLGNLMGKVRPNWFVGIRTPWTLSSKLAWTRTHRIGGWLFVASGALTMLAALLWPVAAVFVLIGSTLATVVWSMVYSYRVWQADPERVPASGVRPADNG